MKQWSRKLKTIWRQAKGTGGKWIVICLLQCGAYHLAWWLYQKLAQSKEQPHELR